MTPDSISINRKVSTVCFLLLSSPALQRWALRYFSPEVNVLSSLYHISKNFFFFPVIDFLELKNKLLVISVVCVLKPNLNEVEKFVDVVWWWGCDCCGSSALCAFAWIFWETSFLFRMCIHLSLPAISHKLFISSYRPIQGPADCLHWPVCVKKLKLPRPSISWGFFIICFTSQTVKLKTKQEINLFVYAHWFKHDI